MQFDETTDVVIVGSGGGSMCAALYLRSVGKSVVILEKTDLVGGCTSRSGGVMWIPNNRFLKADGVADSEGAALTYMDAVIGPADDLPGSTKERRQAYVREGANMVDFLVQQGIKLRRLPFFPDSYDDRPGGLPQGRTVVAELFDVNELGEWKERLRPTFLPVPGNLDEFFDVPTAKKQWKGKLALAKIALRVIGGKITGKNVVSTGQALQGRMLQAALKAGADIRTEHPVKQLVIEGDRVVGVVTTKAGREWRVGAGSGVLINAGGFARNQEMRDRYCPGTSVEWNSSPPGDTGEMIEEMSRIGAALAQMDARVGMPTVIPPGPAPEVKAGAPGEIAKPHAILVDQSGVRYVSEGGSEVDIASAMLRRNQSTPASPSWMVFDSRYFQNYSIAGMPAAKAPQAWFDEGFVRRADTLEALAASCKMDPATLKATVERFNGFARNNNDEDFQRGANANDKFLGDPLHEPSPSLGTIEEGPFYASPVVPGDVGTYGGVVTDAHARVLRQNGSVIEGLYATGNCTASVMGRTYPGPGASVGPSFAWGYIAAKHAAHSGKQTG